MARAYQPMNERDKPDSLRDLDDRLRRLREREGSDRAQPNRGGDSSSDFGMAMRIGAELVAALLVGGGIGLLLDRWLGTAPWLLVVFFLVGAAAGMLNVYRTMSGLGHAVGYPTRLPREEDKDPDD